MAAGSADAFGPVDPDPLHGPVGSRVVIEGTGFDPLGDYTLTLGETELSVESVTETAIETTIPTGVTGGFFTISDGVQSTRSERTFIVTRPISVSYDADLTLDTSGYDLGTL